MAVLQCMPPSQPSMDSNSTGIFGAPKGRPGRALPSQITETPISAIAIHCLKENYDAYIAKLCVSATKMAIGCHASMHYLLDAETGRLTSLVEETNVAWAFQEYRTNFPVTTPRNCCLCPQPCPAPPCPSEQCTAEEYVGWLELSAEFPNIAADFYTINIGISVPARAETASLDGCTTQCIGPYGLSFLAYTKLIQLIAWIQSRYAAITIDAEHIAFHDDIVVRETDCKECICNDDGACVLCDVSSYCEKCSNPTDPTLTVADEVIYLFGESAAGCRVKIPITTLATAICAECGTPIPPDPPEPDAQAILGGLVYMTPSIEVCDTPGIGQPGIQVNLYRGNTFIGASLINTALTNINGRYTFTGLIAGNYWVEVVYSSVICTTNPLGPIALSINETDIDNNFGLYEVPTIVTREVIFPTYGTGHVNGGGVWHDVTDVGWVLKNNGLPADWYWTAITANPLNKNQWLLLGASHALNNNPDAHDEYSIAEDGQIIGNSLLDPVQISPLWRTNDLGLTWEQVILYADILPFPDSLWNADHIPGFYVNWGAYRLSTDWSQAVNGQVVVTATVHSKQTSGFFQSISAPAIWRGTGSTLYEQVVYNDVEPVENSTAWSKEGTKSMRPGPAGETMFACNLALPGGNVGFIYVQNGQRTWATSTEVWTDPTNGPPDPDSYYGIDLVKDSRVFIAVYWGSYGIPAGLWASQDYRTGILHHKAVGSSFTGSCTATADGAAYFTNAGPNGNQIAKVTDLFTTPIVEYVTQAFPLYSWHHAAVRSGRQQGIAVAAFRTNEAGSTHSFIKIDVWDGTEWIELEPPVSIVNSNVSGALDILEG